MITICMYCEVEDPDKFSEPFLFYLLSNNGKPVEFETRQQAETFLLNSGVSPSDLDSFLFIDNILKIVLDGLNGVAYADDKQVIEVRCRKFYSVSSGYLKVSVSEVKA